MIRKPHPYGLAELMLGHRLRWLDCPPGTSLALCLLTKTYPWGLVLRGLPTPRPCRASLRIYSASQVILHDRTPGARVRLRLRGPVGGGFIQLDTDSESIIRVQPGYTGSPVILTDGSGDTVIAMLAATSSSEQVTDAYAIPVSRLADVWSFLDDERSTLRRIVRTAINSAVDQVVDIGDQNAVRELLLSASADIGDMRAADVNDLPQMFLERLGPALTVLDEQGYEIQRTRLTDALFQHIVAGIQADVVGMVTRKALRNGEVRTAHRGE